MNSSGYGTQATQTGSYASLRRASAKSDISSLRSEPGPVVLSICVVYVWSTLVNYHFVREKLQNNNDNNKSFFVCD